MLQRESLPWRSTFTLLAHIVDPGGYPLPESPGGMRMSPRYNLMGFVLIWFLIISPISSANLKDIKLVYSTWRKDGSQDIYLIEDINLKHLKPIRLTQHPAPDFHPRWSPDGKNIVFVSRRDGNDEIYIMDITSGEIERLTHNPARDLEPAWSSEGRKIAFISNRDPNSSGIYDISNPKHTVSKWCRLDSRRTGDSLRIAQGKRGYPFSDRYRQ